MSIFSTYLAAASYAVEQDLSNSIGRTVMGLRIPYKARNILTGWVNVSFARRWFVRAGVGGGKLMSWCQRRIIFTVFSIGLPLLDHNNINYKRQQPYTFVCFLRLWFFSPKTPSLVAVKKKCGLENTYSELYEPELVNPLNTELNPICQ